MLKYTGRSIFKLLSYKNFTLLKFDSILHKKLINVSTEMEKMTKI